MLPAHPAAPNPSQLIHARVIKPPSESSRCVAELQLGFARGLTRAPSACACASDEALQAHRCDRCNSFCADSVLPGELGDLMVLVARPLFHAECSDARAPADVIHWSADIFGALVSACATRGAAQVDAAFDVLCCGSPWVPAAVLPLVALCLELVDCMATAQHTRLQVRI